MKILALRFALFLGAITPAFFAGCTVGKYTNEDAPLTPVKFESMQAEQAFYNAILAKHFPAKDENQKNSKEYSAAIDLPLPLWVENDTHKSYRVIVNEAIAKADVNQDGVISESEAQAYAESIAVKADKK